MIQAANLQAEAESKEKHVIWDPMLELNITSTHLLRATLCQSRPYPYATIDFIPQAGTLDLTSGLNETGGHICEQITSIAVLHQR